MTRVEEAKRWQFSLRMIFPMMACVVGLLCVFGHGAFGYFFGPLLFAVALEANGNRRTAHVAWIVMVMLWFVYPLVSVIPPR